MIKKFVLLSLLFITALDVMAVDANDVLNELKTRIAPDKRVAIWDVSCTMQDGVAIVNGTVGYQEQLDAITDELLKNKVQYQLNQFYLSILL